MSSLSDGTAYSLALTYAPNGDLLTGNDSVNGNWTYGYDDFNRLKSASATGQAYTFDYDRFGNRWHQNGPYTVLESFSSNNNRMDGFSYDSAGNLLNDGTHNYSYDGENRVKQVDGGSTATYTYDALGNRVRKSTSTNVDYLYDSVGHAIAEVSSTGGLNRGEIYGGDRHIGTYGSNATYFIHADHLGTERRRTDVSGGSIETCTSLAFGDHLSCSGSDVSPLHFTGKERDTESGLDYFGARYYGSNIGRFISPDPKILNVQRFLDPQQWNMYVYTRNNPLIYIDPDGRELHIVLINTGGRDSNSMQNIGRGIVAKFQHVGVKNVDFTVVNTTSKLRTAYEQVQAAVSKNTVAVEIAKSHDDEKGLVHTSPTNTNDLGDTKGLHAGENNLKASVVDADRSANSDQTLINDSSHELGHGSGLHDNQNAPEDIMTSPTADPGDPSVEFSPSDAKKLQDKYNEPDEKERGKPDKKPEPI